MSITIKDVAREANVSIATVSRALNRKPGASPAAIEAVEAATQKLGYTVNLMARDLRKSESRRLLIVTASIARPFYADVLAGIEPVAADAGYSILCVTNNDDPTTEMRHLEELLFSRAVDGAILLAPKLDAKTLTKIAKSHNIAVCLERLEGCNALTVTTDNVRAGKEAVDYLFRKGHKKIAMISTTARNQSSVDRERGYALSLKEHGVDYNDDYIYYGDYTYESGVQGCLNLLGLHPAPTAMFCVSDIIAMGAVAAAAGIGKRIGKDMAFIGFDNIPFSRIVKPYLSTVEQPYEQQGEIVARKLIANIVGNSDKTADKGVYKLPHRLILRETT